MARLLGQSTKIKMECRKTLRHGYRRSDKMFSILRGKRKIKKRTYESYKDYALDMSFENDVKK